MVALVATRRWLRVTGEDRHRDTQRERRETVGIGANEE